MKFYFKKTVKIFAKCFGHQSDQHQKNKNLRHVANMNIDFEDKAKGKKQKTNGRNPPAGNSLHQSATLFCGIMRSNMGYVHEMYIF